MIYLPTMLILTLAASLIVAFFNPVFAVSFMKPEGKQYDEPKKAIFKKPFFWTAIIFGADLKLNRLAWFRKFSAVHGNTCIAEQVYI